MNSTTEPELVTVPLLAALVTVPLLVALDEVVAVLVGSVKLWRTAQVAGSSP